MTNASRLKNGSCFEENILMYSNKYSQFQNDVHELLGDVQNIQEMYAISKKVHEIRKKSMN